MELAKLLLKLLYLALLYVVIYVIVKPQVQISGANLSVVVLTLSILLMYVTFDSIYDFMTTNEIVIKNDKEDKEEDTDTKEATGHSKTEIVDKIHKEQSADFVFDHTHKFVQDKVFG